MNKFSVDKSGNVLVDDILINYDSEIYDCNNNCMECLRRFKCLNYLVRFNNKYK